MKRNSAERAFTLVELLVVIGIIALLISILLPALGRARQSAYALKCASNLRSIGQGLAIYVSENGGTYPAAYLYSGHAIANGVQTPDQPTNGYIHWSSYLYKKNSAGASGDAIYRNTFGWDAFLCPSLDQGGLPPTNTYLTNLDGGQTAQFSGVVDQQAPRVAYTVNEAIMPRNKFVVGFAGSTRTYQFVKASQIRRSAQTILATEFNSDWHIVSEATGSGEGPGGAEVCKSHRPIHGFVGQDGTLDMNLLSRGGFGRSLMLARRCTSSDLSPNPTAGAASSSRLDWVGRNHYPKKDNKGAQIGKSNFLYCDGHVETKTVAETIAPQFEWGAKFYSLVPNGDVQSD